jgi:D-glycero-alpha-D-manno-heptose-7-phosphate kinase
VLSTSIDKYCYISCRYLPPFFEHKYRVVYSKIENCKTIDQIEHPAVRAVLSYMQCDTGLEIHHDGDLPARSGLGSSSSFTVGLLNALSALKGNYIANYDLASQAIHIERDIIKENVGSQDQISAAHGGFNRIEFLRDGSFRVDPVVLRQERIEEFQSHLMLFFTGLSRFASDIAKSKIDNLKNRAAELHRMTESVHEAIRILQSDAPIEEIGRLLDQNWKYKRSLSDKVSSPEIDQIYEAAMKAGAIGGKLLGAGGGGFMVFLVKPALQKKVREALSHLIHVPFRFENNGSRVVLYQPQGL